MFLKPFRVKSQTQVKGSDKKKIRAEVALSFPNVQEEDLQQMVPGKGEMTLVRLYSTKGESFNVYQVQKDPFFFKFEKEKDLFPTVYMLWKFPNLLHTFTTQPPVIDKLAKGADLMLPGIVLKGEMTPNSYGKFDKNTPVAVNTTTNQAPMAVGLTYHSSFDMFMSGKYGKGVSVLHVFGDHLWEMGSKALPPQLGQPEVMVGMEDKQDEDPTEDFSEEAQDQHSQEEVEEDLMAAEIMESLILKEEESEEETKVATDDSTPAQEEPEKEILGPDQMDQLLVHCFLKAWKTSAKTLELPVLTSNFYRRHMVPSCPDGATMDVKKSNYKKLSKFLNAMQKRGIIEVKEFPKGVENITSVLREHNDIVAFTFNKAETTRKVESTGDGTKSFVPPTLEEVHQVSGETVKFFLRNGLAKGDVLNTAQVREIVTNYIKREGLQKKGEKNVTLNPLLHEAVVNRKEGYKETLRWDEIFSRMLGKMAPAVRITRNDAIPIIRKGKLEPITIALAKRSGNKKVTLIYNVGIYGIDEGEFAHQVQIGVAASTAVGPAENKPQGVIQVLIQGNQVAFVGKLLIETYKIPRKYIRGLELAIKSKK
ncbi:eukaryotic translation initiation factor 2D [Oratosquilla oratoria]|uniref:eukaryotic translation initiation factor 2D n=1 Tax=Oratosquilla oratoria TaxID=337810 RepID=UPI003F769393